MTFYTHSSIIGGFIKTPIDNNTTHFDLGTVRRSSYDVRQYLRGCKISDFRHILEDISREPSQTKNYFHSLNNNLNKVTNSPIFSPVEGIQKNIVEEVLQVEKTLDLENIKRDLDSISELHMIVGKNSLEENIREFGSRLKTSIDNTYGLFASVYGFDASKLRFNKAVEKKIRTQAPQIANLLNERLYNEHKEDPFLILRNQLEHHYPDYTLTFARSSMLKHPYLMIPQDVYIQFSDEDERQLKGTAAASVIRIHGSIRNLLESLVQERLSSTK